MPFSFPRVAIAAIVVGLTVAQLPVEYRYPFITMLTALCGGLSFVPEPRDRTDDKTGHATKP